MSREAELAASMAAARLRLDAPLRRIETTFLELGSRLGDGAEIASDLSLLLAETEGHVGAADPEAQVAGLRAVADRAAAVATRFAEEQGAMQALGLAVEGARRPLMDLERAVRTIGIIATTARVASAPLESRKHDVGFFSTDLEMLASRAAATVRAFSDTYAGLADDIREGSIRHARFEAEYRNRLAELPTTLGRQLAEAAEHCRASQGAAEEVRRASDDVGRRIGGAVSGLQAGDSVRQRVEHVEAALARLLELEGPSRLPSLELGAALQAAQLDGAGGDFGTEAAAVRAQMAALADDAAAMVEGGRRLLARPSDADHPFQALRRTVKPATALLRACETERTELDRLAAAVASVLERLFEQLRAVQRVEADIQLLGINAAIRCSRLGADGRALTVISDQLTELTTETRRAVADAAEQLQRAVAPAEAISAAAGGGEAGELARLEAEAQASLAELDALDQRLQAAEEALERQAPRAAGLLAQASQAFDAQAEIVEELRTAGDALGEAVGSVPTKRAPPPDAAAIFDDLRAAYTMDAERRIFDAIVAAPQPLPAAAAS